MWLYQFFFLEHRTNFSFTRSLNDESTGNKNIHKIIIFGKHTGQTFIIHQHTNIQPKVVINVRRKLCNADSTYNNTYTSPDQNDIQRDQNIIVIIIHVKLHDDESRVALGDAKN